MKQNNIRRSRRAKRIRLKLKSKNNLRLSLFRSNSHIYAQLIDDVKGITLLSASSIEKSFRELKEPPKKIAYKVGEKIGEKIKEKKIISKICLDRGCYLYHGRIKELAMGVRSKGIKF
ncbi:MAG: 50S ribosomal protein L18 [Rickettsiales bacterium]|mgnify:CR=1 FL=1|nr:50S ribosomal protein L18 [Rickettsiales bacterium]|tara:strand:- start:17 stop:370 length:354 start_codon:yes stop_codon:yes gene_type:complete